MTTPDKMELDEKDRRLIALVWGEQAVSTEDPCIDEFADDRGKEDDTINRCINAGEIRQVGNSDTDNYYLVPIWWPYNSAEQFATLKGRAALSAPSTDAKVRG